MQFNRYGYFNVPFCHKPDRFSRSYITKITNQVRAFRDVLKDKEWRFEVCDFRETLSRAKEHDFIYVDSPYSGRHVDYFNTWDADDEASLIARLEGLPCRFLLSTWHSNKYRANSALEEHWDNSRFSIMTFDHFYHVGPSEELRHPMLEALVANYPLPNDEEQPSYNFQLNLPFVETN